MPSLKWDSEVPSFYLSILDILSFLFLCFLSLFLLMLLLSSDMGTDEHIPIPSSLRFAF